MFSRIHRRITFANVAMTLALVFAMSGGALAASKYLITSTKQIKPSVVAQLKGKNGKNGTNGTNGTNGVNGEKGASGTPGEKGASGTPGEKGALGTPGESVTASAFSVPTGTCTGAGSEFTIGTSPPTFACNGKAGATGAPGGKGANGESVTMATEPKGANCEEGGEAFKVGAGTPTYACNGSPWTAGGTLPSGQSETGAWGSTFTAVGLDPISFTIPLKTAPVAAGWIEEGNTTNAHCHGNLAAPTADKGYLCVYAGTPLTPATFMTIVVPGTETNGAGTTGAIVELGTAEPLSGWAGTWAVKAA